MLAHSDAVSKQKSCLQELIFFGGHSLNIIYDCKLLR